MPARIVGVASRRAAAGALRSTPSRTNWSRDLLIPARADLERWGWVILETGPQGFSVWVTVLPQPASASSAQPAARSAAARAVRCPRSTCATRIGTESTRPLLAVDQRVEVDVVDPHPGVRADRREAEPDVLGERGRDPAEHADRRRR